MRSLNAPSFLHPEETPFPDDGRPLVQGLENSHSRHTSFLACPHAWWLQGPGAWGGWRPGIPSAVFDRYLAKGIKGAYGNFGALDHEGTEWVDKAAINSLYFPKTGTPPATNAQIRDAFEQKFDKQWEDSRTMTWNAWKKERTRRDRRKGEDEPVWLREHALYHLLNERHTLELRQIIDNLRSRQNDRILFRPENDAADKARLWRWAKQALENYIANRARILQGAPPDDWLVVEGHKLEKGMVVDDLTGTKSQAQQWKKRIFPKAELLVDGVLWYYYYTMDRLVLCRKDGRYYFIDLKAGVEKLDENGQNPHVEQVAIYAALAAANLPALRGVDPERFVIRIAYLNGADRESPTEIRDFEYDKGEMEACIERAKDHCRLQMQRLRLLATIDKQKLLELMPAAWIFGRDGVFNEHRFPQDTYVALEENFPPEAARRKAVRQCAQCDCLALCKEGSDLVGMRRLL
ncbi:MAG: hypothetical protein IT290_05100 [Deltaproteobacteria bacterium]|nr:hypothetical protein [Deltaproteobacteria bacterium]